MHIFHLKRNALKETKPISICLQIILLTLQSFNSTTQNNDDYRCFIWLFSTVTIALRFFCGLKSNNYYCINNASIASSSEMAGNKET